MPQQRSRRRRKISSIHEALEAKQSGTINGEVNIKAREVVPAQPASCEIKAILSILDGCFPCPDRLLKLALFLQALSILSRSVAPRVGILLWLLDEAIQKNLWLLVLLRSTVRAESLHLVEHASEGGLLGLLRFSQGPPHSLELLADGGVLWLQLGSLGEDFLSLSGFAQLHQGLALSKHGLGVARLDLKGPIATLHGFPQIGRLAL
mmetsp:Transcript_54796/g.120149  ORF Transcript_54796/g.120149 Transcript_54796/m.120149 type:complete len:207 (-) Transcript_54796:149-769(-)